MRVCSHHIVLRRLPAKLSHQVGVIKSNLLFCRGACFSKAAVSPPAALLQLRLSWALANVCDLSGHLDQTLSHLQDCETLLQPSTEAPARTPTAPVSPSLHEVKKMRFRLTQQHLLRTAERCLSGVVLRRGVCRRGEWMSTLHTSREGPVDVGAQCAHAWPVVVAAATAAAGAQLSLSLDEGQMARLMRKLTTCWVGLCLRSSDGSLHTSREELAGRLRKLMGCFTMAVECCMRQPSAQPAPLEKASARGQVDEYLVQLIHVVEAYGRAVVGREAEPPSGEEPCSEFVSLLSALGLLARSVRSNLALEYGQAGSEGQEPTSDELKLSLHYTLLAFCKASEPAHELRPRRPSAVDCDACPPPVLGRSLSNSSPP